MNIVVTPTVFDLDPKLFERILGNERSNLFRYSNREGESIDLRFVTDEDLDLLEETIAKAKGRGSGKTAAVRNIRIFRRLREGDADGVKAKSVEMAAALLTDYLKDVEGHRIYDVTDDNFALSYYVNRIQYVPPLPSRSGPPSPPYVAMELLFEQYGARMSRSVHFGAIDVMHKTGADMLSGSGFLPEGDELRDAYLAAHKRYREIGETVGLRVRAKGIATPDLDGNPEKEDRSGFVRNHLRYTKIRLDRENGPTRGVVDVYSEEGNKARGQAKNAPNINVTFWAGTALRADDEDDFEDPTLSEEELAAAKSVEIPVHPWVPFFDFTRHLRMSVHVENLDVDPYDTALGEKLVLPKVQRRLIDVLVGNDATFEDVVGGKSGGSIILTAGPPGVGKTLTAEVYSEVVSRPLYSVQCAQLGTHADDLEESLRRIFFRASRWNAILLLDEADVYISKRGSDLQQNAIVGVFLRTLEYFPGTLFLTTNRSESVDDAIASRCIARIDYKLPTPGQQAEIWRILAETSGIEMASGAIEKITSTWAGLSGRDVKNLLKLAHMVTPNEPITFETVEMVKPFKSTKDVSKGPKKRRSAK